MALTPEGTPYVESSDLVANYPAASLSLANRVDLVGVLPFASAVARTTAIPSPTDGQYSYLQDTNATEFYNGTAWQSAVTNKFVQLIRAIDSTDRTTTSTSFVDSNLAVTITPTKNTSTILLFVSVCAQPSGGALPAMMQVQITDAANVAISGAEDTLVGVDTTSSVYDAVVLIGYASPATISPVTYKLRFRSFSGTSARLRNATFSRASMYAIEVSA